MAECLTATTAQLRSRLNVEGYSSVISLVHHGSVAHNLRSQIAISSWAAAFVFAETFPQKRQP